MTRLVISELLQRFPDFWVAIVVLEGDGVSATRTPGIADFVAQAEADCRTRWAGQELSGIPGVAAWRSAYKGFGIKSTSYRSSVERLVKRVLAGDTLPPINGLVDLYNAVSLAHVLCVGADDLDLVTGDLAFRFAREGDTFLDMAPIEGLGPEQPPKAGEVVYADEAHVLCRRWNWRQDARTIVMPASRRVVVTLQSNGWGSVEAAAEELAARAGAELQMSARWAVADATRDVVDI